MSIQGGRRRLVHERVLSPGMGRTGGISGGCRSRRTARTSWWSRLTAAGISDDLVLASEPGKVIARAQVTLEEALEKLKPSLQKVVHLLKELSPDQTVVEFGLKVGGETGVIIAKGTAEVNFKVTMSWGHE